MKYLIPVLLLLSCSANIPNDGLYDLITDRIWRTNLDQQHWFASQNDRQYIWMTFLVNGSGVHNPFTEAKGTPFSHPMPEESSAYMEGWKSMLDFRIQGDSLIQITDYPGGRDRIVGYFVLKPISDTTINGQTYLRLHATNKNHKQVWRSSK